MNLIEELQAIFLNGHSEVDEIKNLREKVSQEVVWLTTAPKGGPNSEQLLRRIDFYQHWLNLQKKELSRLRKEVLKTQNL